MLLHTPAIPLSADIVRRTESATGVKAQRGQIPDGQAGQDNLHRNKSAKHYQENGMIVRAKAEKHEYRAIHSTPETNK